MLQGQPAPGCGSRNPARIRGGRVGPRETPCPLKPCVGTQAGREGNLRGLQAHGFDAHLGTETGLFTANETTGNLETSLAGLVGLECDIWGRVATRCALRTGASGSSGELSGGVGAELGLSLSLSLK